MQPPPTSTSAPNANGPSATNASGYATSTSSTNVPPSLPGVVPGTGAYGAPPPQPSTANPAYATAPAGMQRPPAGYGQAPTGAPVVYGYMNPHQRYPQTAPPTMLPPQAPPAPTTVPSAPSPATAAPVPTASSQAPQARPLNVRDALSYLDQVKIQFADRPEVYNQFLDIMKEFKSQSIDTPGVIERVSNLFRGHRALIYGFNTFLPPGFQIDLPADENASMTMTTPLGRNMPINTYSPANSTGPTVAPSVAQSSVPGPFGGYAPQAAPPTVNQVQQQPYYGQSILANAGNPSAIASAANANPSILPVTANTSVAPVSTSNVNNAAGNNNANNPPARRGPVEFNHAINYVNKIKQRFASEPEIYKSFLEILHTYQKEQRTIKEVYGQVATLFRRHPDLLDEFSQFLPDPPVNGPVNATAGGANAGANKDNGQAMDGFKRKGNNNAGNVPARYKRSSGATSPTGILPKKIKLHPKMEEIQKAKQEFEEFEFFDKVKRLLSSKVVYAEFLKCLNLYSQEIIGTAELVQLVHGFLGKSPELFEWFKKFVAYKEPVSESFGHIPRDHQAASSNELAELDLSKCKRHGSYRTLPKSHQKAKCSGRTELCHEVLNDAMVSCPSFSSEDNVFLSSKKNQYEEILFKCEEERYEMDLLMDANKAAIQALDPVAKRLLAMTGEEAQKFKLDQSLGGTSEFIYVRAIRRIYADKGNEIMEALKKNPAVAVPVVLRRLKQKDEEWRRAQREWNKIWREVQNKNHYKALDHQGLACKATDRRTMSSKTLISELEALVEEQRQRPYRVRMGRPPVPLHQYEFSLKDTALLDQIARLLAAYLDRSGTAVNGQDKKQMEHFYMTWMKGLLKMGESNGEDSNGANVNNANVNEANNNTSNDSTSANDLIASKKEKVFYGNTPFYLLFRLYQIIYSRLDQLKQLSHRFAIDPPEKRHPIAKGLDLQKPLNPVQRDYFESLLSLTERFLDGSLEPLHYEDKLRHLFGTSAYLCFTMDKLIAALARQIQIIVTDEKCQAFLALFHATTAQHPTDEKASVRVAAEQLLAQEEPGESAMLFRFHYRVLERDSLLTIQYLDKQSLTPSEANSIEEKWTRYLHSYLDPSLRPGSENNWSRYLSRLPKSPSPLVISQHALECKIHIHTFKMSFVEHTEDMLYRQEPQSESRDKCNNKFRQWWEKALEKRQLE